MNISQCITTCLLCEEYIYSVILDAIAVNFLRGRDSVLESENIISVCLQVNPGEFMTERSVTFNVFSVDNAETTGMNDDFN